MKLCINCKFCKADNLSGCYYHYYCNYKLFRKSLVTGKRLHEQPDCKTSRKLPCMCSPDGRYFKKKKSKKK